MFCSFHVIGFSRRDSLFDEHKGKFIKYQMGDMKQSSLIKVQEHKNVANIHFKIHREAISIAQCINFNNNFKIFEAVQKLN
jgi:hypothetical protein